MNKNEVRKFAAEIQKLDKSSKMKLFQQLTASEMEQVLYNWDIWARPEQIIPKELTDTTSKKDIWLIMASRGWGKTKVGSETIRSLVCGDKPKQPGLYKNLGIIAENAADARDTLIEGPSGLMACHPKEFRPKYMPSQAKLVWPNGATALIRNDTAPENLRGPNFDCVWVDEFGKFKNAQETYDQIQMSTRIGHKPVQIYTTTPRTTEILKKIRDDERTILTHGTIFDNIENLAPGFVQAVIDRYEGTRIGRQELYGELLDDIEGALWNYSMFENRTTFDWKEANCRIVVGVDPTGTRNGDDCGIVVAAKDHNTSKYHVLEDASMGGSPNEWGTKVSAISEKYKADRVIAEVNYGGEMVTEVLKQVNPDMPVKTIHSSRGKMIRAEPISALYEQGKVNHNSGADLRLLEEEMTTFTPMSTKSPNRMDAMVFALQELKGKNYVDTSKMYEIKLEGFFS